MVDAGGDDVATGGVGDFLVVNFMRKDRVLDGSRFILVGAAVASGCCLPIILLLFTPL